MFKKSDFLNITVTLLFILVLAILDALLNLLLPYVLSEFIDQLATISFSLRYVSFYILISVALLITGLIQKFCIKNLSWHTINRIRFNMAASILTQKESFFLHYSSSDILEYFEVDIDKIYNFISVTLPLLISNMITAIFIVFYLSLKSLYVLLFFILYIGINILSIKLYSKSKQGCILDESNYHQKMDGIYGEWLHLKNLPATLGKVKIFSQKFSQLQDEWLKHRTKISKYYYTIWCLSLILNTFATFFMLFIGGVLFFNQIISVGAVYLFYSYGKRIQQPMESLQQQFQSGIKCFYSFKRLNTIFNLEKKEHPPLQNSLRETISNITCKNLTYRYENQFPILNNINITFEKGDIVGIYGKSGDGKSTLCRLLVKNLELDGSAITVNNYNLQEVDTKSYLKKVSYFGNDPMVIEGTLYQNLTMFNDSISKKMIIEGLCQYGIDKLIDLNIDSPIHPDKLSNGQKQIIAAVRSFFIGKEVLIFDEAFSEINSDDTMSLMNDILHVNKGKIIILVSHQLSKLTLCTKLYEMQGGVLYEKTVF